jgi:hypothetical protein
MLDAPLLSGGSRVVEEQREFQVNNRDTNKSKKFKSNSIATNKYWALLFIPQNLFYQFQRVANLYFAFQAILQV